MLMKTVYLINLRQFTLLAEEPPDELERFPEQIDANTGRSELAELHTRV